MRTEEVFVMTALSKELGGDFVSGEDPPDAYLTVDGEHFAVEVSIVSEIVETPGGKETSRIGIDNEAFSFFEAIKPQIEAITPQGKQVSLGIPVPLNDLRGTRKALLEQVAKQFDLGLSHVDHKIRNNLISVTVVDRVTIESATVVGYFPSRYSSANISDNVEKALIERISSKAEKCAPVEGTSGYWLALYNHYWLASSESYKSAYSNIGIRHHFDRIYLVTDHSTVHLIHSSA